MICKKQKVDQSPDSVVMRAFEICSEDELSIAINIRSEELLNILEKSNEFDPAICLSFNLDHLQQGVAVVNAMPAAQRPVLPMWFPAGTAYPLTCEQVKSIIMNYTASRTAGGVIDSFFIAPNTLVEATQICTILGILNLDPFFQAVALQGGGYLARTFLFRDSMRNLTGIPANIFCPQLPAGAIQSIL
jgi:hypothetical protein